MCYHACVVVTSESCVVDCGTCCRLRTRCTDRRWWRRRRQSWRGRRRWGRGQRNWRRTARQRDSEWCTRNMRSSGGLCLVYLDSLCLPNSSPHLMCTFSHCTLTVSSPSCLILTTLTVAWPSGTVLIMPWQPLTTTTVCILTLSWPFHKHTDSIFTIFGCILAIFWPPECILTSLTATHCVLVTPDCILTVSPGYFLTTTDSILAMPWINSLYWPSMTVCWPILTVPDYLRLYLTITWPRLHHLTTDLLLTVCSMCVLQEPVWGAEEHPEQAAPGPDYLRALPAGGREAATRGATASGWRDVRAAVVRGHPH